MVTGRAPEMMLEKMAVSPVPAERVMVLLEPAREIAEENSADAEPGRSTPMRCVPPVIALGVKEISREKVDPLVVPVTIREAFCAPLAKTKEAVSKAAALARFRVTRPPSMTEEMLFQVEASVGLKVTVLPLAASPRSLISRVVPPV